MDFWVDLAAIAGFVISLILAVQQIYLQIIKLEIDNVIIATSPAEEGVFFLMFTLTNKRPIPISVIKLRITANSDSADKSDIVYSQRVHDDNFDSGHIAISTRFPLRLDAYESQEICVSFRNQRIAHILCLPELQHNSEAHRLHKVFRRARARVSRILCALVGAPIPPSSLLRVYTSRGKKDLWLEVDDKGGMELLNDYAVRLSILEGKAKFL